MDATRRSLLQAIPMLAASSAFAANSATLSSFVKPYDELPVTQNGKNEAREILDGVLHDGKPLEIHYTTLGAASQPHPPHRHVNEELFVLMKGTLEVTISGKTTTIGPGSVAFAYSNDLHGVYNPGPEKAQYLVVSIGA
jgi:(S)-ureidoglycine aminohydrolase